VTWVKLDDQFFGHPKVIDLSKDAKLLYLAGLTYCSEHLTDGRISPAALRLVAAMVDAPRDATAAELVAAGLWERTTDAYQVHDYLKHQPPAEVVRQKREDARDRMRLLRGANDDDCSQDVRANSAETSREVRRLEVEVDKDVEVRDQKAEVDAEAEDAPSAPAAAALPETVQRLHECLTGQTGYDPSPAFLQKLATKYGHLDLESEALKMLSWLPSKQNKRKQICSTGFVLKWLEGAVTPRGQNGYAPSAPRASPPIAKVVLGAWSPKGFYTCPCGRMGQPPPGSECACGRVVPARPTLAAAR
jgi:hypothetical protein